LAVNCVQAVIQSVRAIHVSTVESALSGTRGTSVIVHTRRSEAGTVDEVCELCNDKQTAIHVYCCMFTAYWYSTCSDTFFWFLAML